MSRSPVLLAVLVAACTSPATDPSAFDTGTVDTEPADTASEPAAVDTGSAHAPSEPGTTTDTCVPRRWWRDSDGDGAGDPNQGGESCVAPPEHVDNPRDCDDTNADLFPGNAERCDGIDQDCDADPDDGLPFVPWYPDADGDGHGDAAQELFTCDGGPDGWIDVGGDCDDAAPAVHPDADVWACDGVDTDCDGQIEEERVPDDHASLQAAIDAAADGGLVCVGPGTWPTEAEVYGKTLVLKGEGAILEGTASTVLSLVDAGTTEVSGFVITGASGRNARGLRVVDSDVRLVDLFVGSNWCVSPDPGGACIGVGIGIEGSTATLDGVVVEDNIAEAAWYARGVGIDVFDSDVTLTDGFVHGNLAVAELVDGAGIAVGHASLLTAAGLDLLDNAGIGGVSGTALDSCIEGLDSSRVDLVDVVAEENHGGLEGISSVVSLCGGPTDSVVRLTLRENVADVGLVGTDLVVHNLLAVGNETWGPLVVADGTLTLEQATVAGNEVHVESAWSAVLFDTDGTAALRNSIVAYNRWIFDAWPPPVPAGTVFGGPSSVVFSDLHATGNVDADVWVGVGNVDLDPLFDADYRAGSALLIDAGEPGSLDADGTVADLGAYGGPHALP